MRKPTFTSLLTASIALGVVSPFFAELGGQYGDPSQNHGLLHAWFYSGPIAAAQTFWFVEDVGMLGLAMVVYALQFLVALTTLRACWPLIAVARDFCKPYRHRVGLIERN